MPGKRIAVRPIEPLELSFKDGTTFRVSFNVKTLIEIAERYGDLPKLVKEGEEKPFETASKILHCGLLSAGEYLSLEEVKPIVMGGGRALIETIYERITESFDDGTEPPQLPADQEPEEIDWDGLYYVYCVQMGQPPEEFYNSSVARITAMIRKHAEANGGGSAPVEEITSMKQIPGW